MKKIIFPSIVLLTSLVSYSQYSLNRILPNNPDSVFSLGSSACASGNTIISNGSFGTTPPNTVNKIYVFEDNGTNTTLTTEIETPEVGQTIGKAIISGDYIFVSSPNNSTNVSGGGAVYVFKKINNTWTYTHKIQPANQTADDHFGTSLAFENNQLLIGAYGYEDDVMPANADNGGIYVYDFTGDDWVFNQILTTYSGYGMGVMIDLENDTFITTSTNPLMQTSYALTLRKIDGTWYLINSFPIPFYMYDFTKTVNYSNNQLFVAQTSGMNTVNISIYDLQSDNTWLQVDTLTPSNGDYVNTTIDVKNNNMVLSGFGGYILMIERKNPAWYYKKENGTWTYKASFTGQSSHNNDNFGNVSYVSDNCILFGNPEEVWNTPVYANGGLYKMNTNLGTEDFQKQSVQIYPNPTADKINIISNENFIKELQLIDFTGKIVKTETQNLSELSLKDLNSGVYVLKIIDAQQNTSYKKIIKQ